MEFISLKGAVIALLVAVLVLGVLCAVLLSNLDSNVAWAIRTLTERISTLQRSIEEDVAKRVLAVVQEHASQINHTLHGISRDSEEIRKRFERSNRRLEETLRHVTDAIQEGPIPKGERSYRKMRVAFDEAYPISPPNIVRWSNKTEVLLIAKDESAESREKTFLWIKLTVRRIVEIGKDRGSLPNPEKTVIFGWRDDPRVRSQRVRWDATWDGDVKVGSLTIRCCKVINPPDSDPKWPYFPEFGAMRVPSDAE